MAYKDILVVADDTDECGERVEIALRLAKRHEAHVIGLIVHHYTHLPRYALMDIPPSLLEIQRETIRKTRARVREKLDPRVARSGVPWEWHSAEGPPLRTAAQFSRHVDLSVVGQQHPERHEPGRVSALAEHLVFSSGRPLLVVPYAGRFPEPGRRILVAWDAGREAARAVADALPLLREAEQVMVVSANPKSSGERDRHGDVPGADIARHLARHGVNVDVQRIETDEISVADMLLNRIAEEAVDLLVMGAYGHSRLGEMFLGGVTRSLMQHMTVPVFMSH